MEKRDFIFEKVVGFDITEKAIEPKKENIEYIIAEELETEKKFDLIIALDSLHTTQDPVQISKYGKENALILISEPEKFKDTLEKFNSFEKLAEGEIGDIEKDYFILIKNK